MRKSSQLHKFLEELQLCNLSTLEAERIVGTTRISNIATTARQKLGLFLPCHLQKYIKKDGSAGVYGVYSPTVTDRHKIAEVLKKAN